MNTTDEMVKLNLVLRRDGVIDIEGWAHEVVAEARNTLILGLLQRAILEVHAHNKAKP